MKNIKLVLLINLLMILPYQLPAQQIIKGQMPKHEWAKGHLILYLNKNTVHVPNEIIGIFVSFHQDCSCLIDSVVFRERFEHGFELDTVSYQTLQTEKPEILKELKLDFVENLINLFKKYNVYYLSTFIKENGFAIKFDKNFDVEEVAEDFRKLKCVKSAGPEKPLIEFDE